MKAAATYKGSFMSDGYEGWGGDIGDGGSAFIEQVVGG